MIVRAAGVTRCALFHHFADKTELFTAVFEP
jgi:AcrR family transcriptional regulator